MSVESTNEFTNVGKKWTDTDIELLKTNYTKNKLSVYQLSIIHKRTMFAIICQLKKIYLILNNEDAIGYSEYVELKKDEQTKLNDYKNNLFKNDYLEFNLSLEDLENKYNLSNIQVLKKLYEFNILKESDLIIYEEKVNNKTLQDMQNDIKEMKNDINQIKNDITEFKNKFNILINILTKK